MNTSPSLALPQDINRTWIKRHPWVAFGLLSLCLGITIVKWWGLGTIAMYGIIAFTLLCGKLVLSILPQRQYDPKATENLRVGAIVTVYNEDPEILRECLDSLLNQTRPVSRIAVVDDCSSNIADWESLQQYAESHQRIICLRQEQNQGKRHALVRGFLALDEEVDVVVGVDSDTILQPDAIANGILPFADAEVNATTAVVLASNFNRNVLTRIIDVRYANAFLTERAAYSSLGSVMCVCGSLAFYRRRLFDQHLDHFLNQRFLGQVVTSGEDRHLTNLALLDGKVVLAPGCVAETAVPERLNHYLRQQTRWGRSFFRESIWALTHLSPRKISWWIAGMEVAQWFVMTTLMVAVVFRTFAYGEFLFHYYVLMVVVMSAAHSLRYWDVMRARQPFASKLYSYSLAPLYGLLILTVVVPLRLFALATSSSMSWGTRSKVEVHAETRASKAS